MSYKEFQGITSRSILYQDTMFGWRYACNYDEKIAAGARLVTRVNSMQATFGEYAVLNYYDDDCAKWNKYYSDKSTEKWRVYSFKLVIR